MKKIVSILVMIMLACTGLTLFVDNDFNVEGSPGGGSDWVNETLLDYTYMFDILDNLTYVVHNDSIWGAGDEVIRMGRAFGTEGDNWTANYIRNESEKLGLENVQKIPLDTIGPENYEGEIPWKYENISWRCDYKIETVDYNLTFNHPDWLVEWSSDGHVPKNESFVMPSAWTCLNKSNPDYHKWTYNNSFMNSKIVHKNIGEKILMEGATSDNYFNVSIDNVTNIDILYGNVTYLTIGENLPDDQECRLFLFDEEQNCEDQLANVTNATGVILIHNDTRGYTANTSSYQNISIGRCNIADNNVSDVIDMLENGTAIFAENINNSEILTFYHNFSYLTWWPKDQNNGLFIIHEFSDWGVIWFWHGVFGALNGFFQECTENGFLHGFIIYDNYDDVHIMERTSRDWRGWDYTSDLGTWYYISKNTPPLQTFLINKTIWDDFLMERIEDEDNTVSGYLEQEEKNVTAYNVLGNITINQSPDDAIIVLEGRPDAWWGECPGDSGAGTGIIMGIAKYIKENEIKPKYNLTFLFTTGEEYGMRGSWYHSLTHPDDNIIYWIGTDQLGFNFEGTGQQTILSNNSTKGDRGIVWAIANETQLVEQSGYWFDTVETKDPQSTNEAAFRWRGEIFGKNCSTICIHKKGWDYHHRAGKNYTEGDSMKYMDREDLNATLNFSWGIVKYYCFNPDAWFTNVSYQVFDSVNDGDALNDSIRANFTLNTILPHDKLRVELLYDIQGGSSDNLYSIQNYSVNSSGLDASVVFSIPDDMDKGDYSIKLVLYNSTGIINKTVFNDNDYSNDTSDESNVFTLYHPFGYTNIGDNFETVDDRITGSNFTVNENGYADNITAYINRAYGPPGPYKCMLYRSNDSELIATTSEDWTPRDYENPYTSMGWAVFNFSEPKPLLTKDTEYIITCWGENQYSRLYYDDFSNTRGRYDNEPYGDPPDPANFNSESRLYSIYCSYTPDNMGPEITSISSNPGVVGYDFNVTIHADVYDISGVDVVKVKIKKPKDTVETQGYDMTHISGDTYEYVFNDTWQNGQYNYSFYVVDANGNSNTSASFSFNVSVNASIKVCTVKDVYNPEEFVNVTDPPANHQLIGYEFLDDGKVLHVWNSFDSYYFNTSNGMQFTNHYNNYWSHNVLMLGYYNNEIWNLIYRVDELSGFNKNIVSDNETFVNITLWKDLTYQGYNFRLAIRYFLGVDDNEITVIPYIKNLGIEIQYVLGFAWELKDIQVDQTPGGDYIEINGTSYYLNQSLNETYEDLIEPCFYIREDFIGNMSESLYLRWDENLDYKVQVKSRDGQYNAPVTLGVKIGTLNVGQEKYTCLFWHDAVEMVYFFDNYDTGDPGESWLNNPDYMVDGNEGTFASTGVDGDVEFLDGNSCVGEDLGVIGKIELRCRGYNSGSGGPGSVKNIILRPVFSGGDGDDHVFVTSSSAGWSVWFNITDDTNAPVKWDWKNVIGLCCDVESNLTSGFTLYCSKVVIRVTYNPYSGPEFSNPYPPDGGMGVPINPLLSITVNHPLGSVMNISWYSNCSGSWQVFGVNNSVYNGTYYQLFSNASVNGVWWYWMVNASDDSVYNNSSVFMFYTGNQSKIVNIGVTNFSGYLLMQVDYLEGEDWVLDTEVVDETSTRTITINGQLGLDTIFNGKVNTNDLSHGSGTYRVYAAFRDLYGDVLVCDDDSLLEATYDFTVNI